MGKSNEGEGYVGREGKGEFVTALFCLRLFTYILKINGSFPFCFLKIEIFYFLQAKYYFYIYGFNS